MNSVGVFWNGHRQFGWELSGTPQEALDKGYDDLSARAKHQTLAQGMWEVRVMLEDGWLVSQGLEVD